MRVLMTSVAAALATAALASAQMPAQPAYPSQAVPLYQPMPLYQVAPMYQAAPVAKPMPVQPAVPVYQAAPIHQTGPACGPNVMDSCCSSGCSQGWYLSVSGGWADRRRVHEVGDNATFLTFDGGFSLSAALGHRFGDFRLEGEFSLQNTEIESAGASTPNGNVASAATGNISLRCYMLNLYYDLPLGCKLKPYFGAGIGFYQSEINSLNPDFFVGAGLPALNTTSDFPFAYQLRAGVSYELNSRTDVFAGYRFFDGNTLTFSAAPFGTFRPNGAITHSIETGLRVKF